MVVEMSEFNQNILKFNYENILKKDDFFVSKSNKHILIYLTFSQIGTKIFKYNRRKIFW